jgi:FKBP-type peptidyl-prolyl cis-trans isomerase FklB
MRTVSILMAAVATASLVSCTAQSPKPTLKTDIDSLSYATGLAQTEGLKMYLVHQAGVDTAYISEFIKGFNEGSQLTGAKDVAYLEGKKIGQMVAKNWVQGMNQQIFNGDSTKTITKNDLLAGFVAGVKNDTTRMTMPFAQAYRQSATERIQERVLFEKYAENREAGEKFLAENKVKEGVQTTESGLQYKVITTGKGEIPTAESKVKVNYKGTLIDSTEFDSSYKRNEPSTFRANGVIKGWTEALTLMPVGSKWELYIPQELAYGSKEQGQIKPFSALIFEVELVGIEKEK